MNETPNDEQVTKKAPNPLLNRFNKMPAESFDLPSRGEFYNNGELDPEVVNGKILIFPMTTVDEITMKSPDMLYDGTAIEKVFSRCMPQIKKPLKLLANDVDYLMVCLRMVTYGNLLEIYWDCPKCKKSEDDLPNDEIGDSSLQDGVRISHRHEDDRVDDFINAKPTYEVNLSKFINDTKKIPSKNDERFTIKLISGEIVKLRPSTYEEITNIYKYDIKTLKTPEELSNYIIESVLTVVESVNGHTDKDDIAEWAAKCEAPVLDDLRQKMSVANDWGTNFDYDFTCRKCNKTTNVSIPLNPIHFFSKPSI